MGNQSASLEGAEELLTDATHQRGRDKYSQRLKHKAGFVEAIQNFTGSLDLGTAAEPGLADGGIRVAVRKRPLDQAETESGQFDAVTCGSHSCWVHAALMRVKATASTFGKLTGAGAGGPAEPLCGAFAVRV